MSETIEKITPTPNPIISGLRSQGNYVFFSVLLLVGIVFGAWTVQVMDVEQSTLLKQWAKGMAASEQGWQVENVTDAWKQSLFLYIKWFLIVWVCGCTVIGVPLIFLLYFMKGILLGFTIGFLTQTAGWYGVLYATITLLPSNLLFIPLFLVAGASALTFARTVIQLRFVEKNGSLMKPFLTHLTINMMCLLASTGIALLNVSSIPTLLNWFTQFIPGLRIFV